MIDHHARFRENDDLPLWRGPAKKKPPFLNTPALITRKIMHSSAMQYWGITLRWLKAVSSTFQDVDFDVSLLTLVIN